MRRGIKYCWMQYHFLILSILFMGIVIIRGNPRNGGVPVVLNYTSNISVRVHGALNLTCPITIEGKMSTEFFITWNVNGIDQDMLTYDSHFTFLNDNRVLQVSNLRPQDTGMYICNGVTGYGQKSAKFYVKAIDDKFCPNLQPSKKQGGNARMEQSALKQFKPCFISPQLTRIAERQKKGHSSSSSSSSFFDSSPDSSFISAPTSGYQIVRNVGDSVEFDCTAVGHPAPRYLWMKDSSSADWITNITSVRKSILRISNVRFDYSGHYTCKVFNRLGQISYTYSLIVREQHSKVPTILNGLMNITAKLRSQVMFIGSIACSCKPAIHWLKEETVRQENLQYVQIQKPQTSEMGKFYSVIDQEKDENLSIDTALKPNGILVTILRFKSVSINNSGKYVLFSRSDSGFNYKTAFLIVVDPNSKSLEDRSSPRLVLFIAIPIFILLLCFGVLFYCWSHAHSSSSAAGRNNRTQSATALNSCKAFCSGGKGSSSTASSGGMGGCSNGGRLCSSSPNAATGSGCLDSAGNCNGTASASGGGSVSSSVSKSLRGTNNYQLTSTVSGNTATGSGANGSSIVYQKKLSSDNSIPLLPPYIPSKHASDGSGVPILYDNNGIGTAIATSASTSTVPPPYTTNKTRISHSGSGGNENGTGSSNGSVAEFGQTILTPLPSGTVHCTTSSNYAYAPRIATNYHHSVPPCSSNLSIGIPQQQQQQQQYEIVPLHHSPLPAHSEYIQFPDVSHMVQPQVSVAPIYNIDLSQNKEQQIQQQHYIHNH